MDIPVAQIQKEEAWITLIRGREDADLVKMEDDGFRDCSQGQTPQESIDFIIYLSTPKAGLPMFGHRNLHRKMARKRQN